MQKIIVILGPTATGKSDLAVKIARKLNGLNRHKVTIGRTSRGEVLGEVISADSRQVYKGLNIGTGKITKKEMRGVTHHLLDVASPKRQFTAAEFVKIGREKIAAIFSRGKLPIICGGTGFYISALLGEVSLSQTPPNPALRKRLAKKSAAELFAMLQKLNPERAIKIDRHNPRRLIRAIEIAKNADECKSRTRINTDKNTKSTHTLVLRDRIKQVYDVLIIGLTLPPEKLKRKISIRLFARIREGMITEAKRLHKNGLSWKRMNELGLEYRYLSRFLQNKITRPEMINKLETEIWRYAKRQTTWFKRDKEIKWFEPTNLKQIEQSIKLFLKK